MFICVKLKEDTEEFKFLAKKKAKGVKINNYVERLLSWHIKRKLKMEKK